MAGSRLGRLPLEIREVIEIGECEGSVMVSGQVTFDTEILFHFLCGSW